MCRIKAGGRRHPPAKPHRPATRGGTRGCGILRAGLMFGGLEAYRGACFQKSPPYQALVGVHDGDETGFDANSERASTGVSAPGESLFGAFATQDSRSLQPCLRLIVWSNKNQTTKSGIQIKHAVTKVVMDFCHNIKLFILFTLCPQPFQVPHILILVM